MPRRKRWSKRQRLDLGCRELLYVGIGPTKPSHRSGPLGGAWAAWNAEHGRAWRFQHGVPHNSDHLSACELLTGERPGRVDQAETKLEALLAGGIGYDLLGLDVEHPDPPGLAAEELSRH